MLLSVLYVVQLGTWTYNAQTVEVHQVGHQFHYFALGSHLTWQNGAEKGDAVPGADDTYRSHESLAPGRSANPIASCKRGGFAAHGAKTISEGYPLCIFRPPIRVFIT